MDIKVFLGIELPGIVICIIKEGLLFEYLLNRSIGLELTLSILNDNSTELYDFGVDLYVLKSGNILFR
tara:strand:+ start:787 stop:990 length:204 start_codon:yes stop_codon:yes gene_type:complete